MTWGLFVFNSFSPSSGLSYMQSHCISMVTTTVRGVLLSERRGSQVRFPSRLAGMGLERFPVERSLSEVKLKMSSWNRPKVVYVLKLYLCFWYQNVYYCIQHVSQIEKKSFSQTETVENPLIHRHLRFAGRIWLISGTATVK